LIHLIINGKPRSFENAELTVSQLVTSLGLDGKRLALERNGEIVPRSAFAQTLLNSDDRLEIVGAVGGG
jgi:sulfur carrier protein